MKKIFHSASSRGEANHGWLDAKHSFSFANYFNPERIQFGALRVLNDDIIAPGMGFGTHPHDNMEIITIPLKGALEHKDSMDNVGVIEADELVRSRKSPQLPRRRRCAMLCGAGVTEYQFRITFLEFSGEQNVCVARPV